MPRAMTLEEAAEHLESVRLHLVNAYREVGIPACRLPPGELHDAVERAELMINTAINRVRYAKQLIRGGGDDA